MYQGSDSNRSSGGRFDPPQAGHAGRRGEFGIPVYALAAKTAARTGPVPRGAPLNRTNRNGW